MIAVTAWQWIMELVIVILIKFLLIIEGENRALDHFIILICAFFFFVIEPAFYLLADIEFRIAFKEKGLMKAIMLPLKQKY